MGWNHQVDDDFFGDPMIHFLSIFQGVNVGVNTLPETNMFAPENGWLEYDPFLLGPGLFSGAFAVSFREGTYFSSNYGMLWKRDKSFETTSGVGDL